MNVVRIPIGETYETIESSPSRHGEERSHLFTIQIKELRLSCLPDTTNNMSVTR